MMTNDWNNKTKHCVSSILQNKATFDKNRNILAASICVYNVWTELEMTSNIDEVAGKLDTSNIASARNH